MGIFVFSIAAILSLPKQFITVYLGVILEQSGQGLQTPFFFFEYVSPSGIRQVPQPIKVE